MQRSIDDLLAVLADPPRGRSDSDSQARVELLEEDRAKLVGCRLIQAGPSTAILRPLARRARP